MPSPSLRTGRVIHPVRPAALAARDDLEHGRSDSPEQKPLAAQEAERIRGLLEAGSAPLALVAEVDAHGTVLLGPPSGAVS